MVKAISKKVVKKAGSEIKTKTGLTRWMTQLDELLEPLNKTRYFEDYMALLKEFPIEWKQLLEYCLQPRTAKEILDQGFHGFFQTGTHNDVKSLVDEGFIKAYTLVEPHCQKRKFATTHYGQKVFDLLSDLC